MRPSHQSHPLGVGSNRTGYPPGLQCLLDCHLWAMNGVKGLLLSNSVQMRFYNRIRCPICQVCFLVTGLWETPKSAFRSGDAKNAEWNTEWVNGQSVSLSSMPDPTCVVQLHSWRTLKHCMEIRQLIRTLRELVRYKNLCRFAIARLSDIRTIMGGSKIVTVSYSLHRVCALYVS